MLNSRHQEYLDSLPLDWETMPIENIGATYSGGTPSRDNPEFWNGNIDWVTPGELTKLSSKWLTQTRERITQAGLSGSGAVLLPKDALLVTTRATIGAVAIAGMPVATNQGFKSIVLDSSNDPLFYFYVIRKIASEFSRLAFGSTFDEISRRDFVRVVVPQPPLPEQRRIAAILDLADEAIEKTEALISKLKQTKRGLMHDLLARGIDERGNLRDPEANPEQFKDSPLGRIPGEWEIVSVGQTGAIFAGGTPSRDVPQYWDGEVDWITPTDMTGNQSMFIEGGREKITLVGLENSAAIRLPAGTVLVTSRATLGVAAIASTSLATNQGFKNLVPNSSYSSKYLYYALTTLGPEMVRRASGSTFLEISRSQFAAMQVAAPPLDEQRHIAENLDAHDERIRAEEAYVEKLRLQKRGLTEDLLTGRVRVGGGKETPA